MYNTFKEKHLVQPGQEVPQAAFEGMPPETPNAVTAFPKEVF